MQMAFGPEVQGSSTGEKREFLENSKNYLRCNNASIIGTLCSAKPGCRVAQLVKCLTTMDESIRMTEDRDKWSRYVCDVADLIEDG